MFALRGSLSFLQGNLSQLQQLNWIDKNTRAVFAEFSAYNTNINLVMVASILVEFLESGAILMSAKFQPLNLFGEIGTQDPEILAELTQLLEKPGQSYRVMIHTLTKLNYQPATAYSILKCTDLCHFITYLLP